MLNWLFPHLIPDWAQHVIFPLNRWLHDVCTTLLVGGTLFYEFVIPKAIEDLKEETQLAVLGRVRWYFRQIVILSALLLIGSGSLAAYHQWHFYQGVFHEVQPWLILHVSLGIFALVVAVLAMARTRAPRHPLTWLRVNFVIFMIVIFCAATARHVRFMVRENIEKYHISNSDPNTVTVNPP
jgi:uncharacterized membrane protein